MKKLIFLTDYKGRFGSKYRAFPYRSGMDKEKLKKYLDTFNVGFMSYSDVDLNHLDREPIYIHDSTEDTGYYYKAYMEDVVYGLELAGAKLLPGHRYIKAHNNKVFMELLRSTTSMKSINNLQANHFGTLEEFSTKSEEIKLPAVIKGAGEAQSRQVSLAKDIKTALKNIFKVSRSNDQIAEFKELYRAYKYKGYRKESKYRKKFILQQFVEGLKHDWKVLVFGDIFYILRRGVPEGDFRASGSKFNYGFGSQSTPPEGIFAFARQVKSCFGVPYISLDISWNGSEFFLMEFQFVSFGSSTHYKSDCYFKEDNGKWEQVFEKLDLEFLYAHAIKSAV